MQNKELNTPLICRGLKDVLIDKTSISDLRTDNLGLIYRGYPISNIVKTMSYEQVIYLLLYGKAPNPNEVEQKNLNERLVKYRKIPNSIIDIVNPIKEAHPLVVLRTAMSALAAYETKTQTKQEETLETLVDRSLYLISQATSLVAIHQALRSGKDVVPDDSTLPHAANFLYRITGHRPSAKEIEIIDKSFILLAEHGSNASTFAGRVAASTGADIYASLTAALASLGGALHGGAMEEVVEMLEAIDYEADVFQQLKRRRKLGKRISGFGHRVYKRVDPRAPFLKAYAQALSEAKGSDLFAKAEMVEQAMTPYKRLGVNVNVDFYLSITYHLLEIPSDMITLTAGLSRMAGWLAHIIEQKENNILIRPSMVYAGEIFDDLPVLD